MAQIQEYMPETEGAGPAGNLSPNLGAIGNLGQGVEDLGKGAMAASDVFYKRQEQQEVSKGYALLATKHANDMAGLDKSINDGTVDPSATQAQWSGFVEKNADQFETAGGKNFYNRLSARFGANLLEHAALGKVHVDGAAAVAEHETGVNAQSNALLTNPAGFQNAIDAANILSVQQVKNGQLSQINADKLAVKDNDTFATKALEGWAQTDPVYAKKLLDSGDFDKYLMGQSKEQMYGKIHMAEQAAETDREHRLKVIHEAQKDNDNKLGNQIIDRMVKGDASAQWINSLPISDSKDKLAWLNAARADAKRKQDDGNPAEVHNLYQQMFLPPGDPNKISDVTQLAAHAAAGDINGKEMKELSGWMDTQSPDGKVAFERRKALYALGTANFVEAKDSFTQTRDPMGPLDMRKWVEAWHAKERTLQAAGKPIDGLTDPSSPDFFGNQIQNFKPSYAERMKRRESNYGGTSSDGNANVLAQAPAVTGSPTLPPVAPLSPKTAAPSPVDSGAIDEMKKRPDETWPQYVARTNKVVARKKAK